MERFLEGEEARAREQPSLLDATPILSPNRALAIIRRTRELGQRIREDQNPEQIMEAIRELGWVLERYCTPEEGQTLSDAAERLNEIGIDLFHTAMRSRHAEVAYYAAETMVNMNIVDEQTIATLSEPRMLTIPPSFFDQHNVQTVMDAFVSIISLNGLDRNREIIEPALRALGRYLRGNSTYLAHRAIETINCDMLREVDFENPDLLNEVTMIALGNRHQSVREHAAIYLFLGGDRSDRVIQLAERYFSTQRGEEAARVLRNTLRREPSGPEDTARLRICRAAANNSDPEVAVQGVSELVSLEQAGEREIGLLGNLLLNARTASAIEHVIITMGEIIRDGTEEQWEALTPWLRRAAREHPNYNVKLNSLSGLAMLGAADIGTLRAINNISRDISYAHRCSVILATIVYDGGINQNPMEVRLAALEDLIENVEQITPDYSEIEAMAERYLSSDSPDRNIAMATRNLFLRFLSLPSTSESAARFLLRHGETGDDVMEVLERASNSDDQVSSYRATAALFDAGILNLEIISAFERQYTQEGLWIRPRRLERLGRMLTAASNDEIRSGMEFFERMVRGGAGSVYVDIILDSIDLIVEADRAITPEINTPMLRIADILVDNNSLRTYQAVRLRDIVQSVPGSGQVRRDILARIGEIDIQEPTVRQRIAVPGGRLETVFTNREQALEWLRSEENGEHYADASSEELSPELVQAQQSAMRIIERLSIPERVMERFRENPPIILMDRTLDDGGAAGLYFPGKNLILVDPDDPDMVRVFLHEYLHYISYLAGRGIRIETGLNVLDYGTVEWMDEGLTELYTTQGIESHVGVEFSDQSIRYQNEVYVMHYFQFLLEGNRSGESGADILWRAYLTGDFNIVRREINERLGENAFENIMHCPNAAEAQELLENLMARRGISYSIWRNGSGLMLTLQRRRAGYR